MLNVLYVLLTRNLTSEQIADVDRILDGTPDTPNPDQWGTTPEAVAAQDAMLTMLGGG